MRRGLIFFIFCVLLNLLGWYLALFLIGNDVDQGTVYRILFVHVPVAWCAFFWVFFGALFGVLTLLAKPEQMQKRDQAAHAAVELGAVFSFLVLATGSIWGKPTWGVWWDWDPRLTSSLVMWFVCCAYLVLRHFTPDVHACRQTSAVVAILNAINVPIVYLSVNLWRSLHQPQTFVQRTQNASSDITAVLLFNFVAMFLLSISIYHLRCQGLSIKETLDEFHGEKA